MRLKLFVLLLLLPIFIFGEQTIGIFTYKVWGMKTWDPDSIQSGIAGSEEAVIYMSDQLAKQGYLVIVYGNPPKDSKYSHPGANPRYIDVDIDDNTKLDFAVSWRMPDAAEKLKKRANKVFLWPHDTIHYRLPVAMIEKFDDVLWLSNWQREQWISYNPAFSKYTNIFGNGINPDQFEPIKNRRNPHSCIYGSNYARGLETLLNIWPRIRNHFPDATLDIYYGWQHWGLLSPEKESYMRAQIAELAPLGVHDHEQVGHEELNRAYENASLWTYPCIGLETFCITALRAQLAGALPVIIEGSALKETVRSGFKCSSQEDYCDALLKAMTFAETLTLEDRKDFGRFVMNEYTWEKLSLRWKELFDQMTENQ